MDDSGGQDSPTCSNRKCQGFNSLCSVVSCSWLPHACCHQRCCSPEGSTPYREHALLGVIMLINFLMIYPEKGVCDSELGQGMPNVQPFALHYHVITQQLQTFFQPLLFSSSVSVLSKVWIGDSQWGLQRSLSESPFISSILFIMDNIFSTIFFASLLDLNAVIGFCDFF